MSEKQQVKRGPVTEEDLMKLPRWARFEIQKLRADIEHLRATIPGQPGVESNVHIDSFIDDPVALPVGARIRFDFSDGRKIVIHHVKGVGDEEVLEIYSSTSVLGINPQSANTVHVTCVKRF